MEMKGGEELTRRVCVGRSAGEGRRASQAEQHVRGPASGRRLARSRNREEPGKPRAAGEGGGASEEAGQVPGPRKLRPVCVPVPRVFVSVIFPQGLCGALLASFLCPLPLSACPKAVSKIPLSALWFLFPWPPPPLILPQQVSSSFPPLLRSRGSG